MNQALRANCLICENNTPSSAMGGIILDAFPDIQLTVQMTTLNLGGHKKTGVIMETYAGGQFIETFGQLPQPIDNCDKGLRMLLLLLPQHFVVDMLLPMVEAICQVTSRPVPQLFDAPSTRGLNFG